MHILRKSGYYKKAESKRLLCKLLIKLSQPSVISTFNFTFTVNRNKKCKKQFLPMRGMKQKLSVCQIYGLILILSIRSAYSSTTRTVSITWSS